MGQGGSALKQCNDCHQAILQSAGDDLDPEEDCTVKLNIYDLSEEWLLANNLFQEVVELGGAFHAGVEIYGQEWSFGSEGVCRSWPRIHDVHVYRQTIAIGETKYDPQEIAVIVEDEMCRKWAGESYDMLAKNCCSFSRSFCKRLTGDSIPDWVDRLPRLLNAVTQPVKGMADVATGMGQMLNSAPASNGLTLDRDVSLEDDVSVYSFATTPLPTPTLSPTYITSDLSLGLRSTIESV